jgi:hypothetical protein
MTGRTIKSHDPDLDQTILDMSSACHRLSLAEEHVILAHRMENADQVLPGAIAKKEAIKDTLRARAGRLNIKASALRLIIDEHERLRISMGRRPTLEQLVRSVDAATDLLRREAQKQSSHAIQANFMAKNGQHMAEAGFEAGEYLKAHA